MARSIKKLPILPAERALKVISGRWKAVILYYLFDGPQRLSALKALMPGITQKVLIEQLREMESTVWSAGRSSPRSRPASNIPQRLSASVWSRSFWRFANGDSTMRTRSMKNIGWPTASSVQGSRIRFPQTNRAAQAPPRKMVFGRM